MSFLNYSKDFFLLTPIPPLFFGLIGSIFGIVSTKMPAPWLGFSALVLIFVFVQFFNTRKKDILFFSIFFIVSAFKTSYLCYYKPALFPLYHVTVEASVDAITYADKDFWKYQTTLKVSRIFVNNTWQKKSCTLQLYTKNNPECFVDDTIHCSFEKIAQPEKDFALYLLKESVDATIFQEHVVLKIFKRPTYSLKRWFSQKKKILHQKIQKLMSRENFALFSSLYLGNKISVKKSLESDAPFFKFWGISHILARSGLHLLLFIILWSRFLSLIPASFLRKQLFLSAITILYFLLSWPSISFNRAFYTFLLYKFFALLNQINHELHIFSFICLLILLENPVQLFFLDFQLTFLLTFFLLWIRLTDHAKKIYIS